MSSEQYLQKRNRLSAENHTLLQGELQTKSLSARVPTNPSSQMWSLNLPLGLSEAGVVGVSPARPRWDVWGEHRSSRSCCPAAGAHWDIRVLKGQRGAEGRRGSCPCPGGHRWAAGHVPFPCCARKATRAG